MLKLSNRQMKINNFLKVFEKMEIIKAAINHAITIIHPSEHFPNDCFQEIITFTNIYFSKIRDNYQWNNYYIHGYR